jgi:hypothetical protein
VADWDAQDEISWSNLTLTGTMPTKTCNPCVLRVTYQSENPLENDTSTDFFQCADIAITPRLNNEEDEMTSAAETTMPDDGGAFDALMAKLRSTSSPFASGAIPVTAAVADPVPTGCTTVSQWEAGVVAAGGGSAGQVGTGSIAYDAVNRLAFNVLLDVTGKHVEAHFSNFTSGALP